MKKLLSLALAAIMVFCLIGGSLAAKPLKDFGDYSAIEAAAKTYGADEQLYLNALQMMVDLGIMAGDGTSLKADQTLNRAEFITMICRFVNGGDLNPTLKAALSKNSTFNDMSTATWAIAYANWAAAEKVTKGIGDGKFGPLDDIIYLDAVLMISRALGYSDTIEGVKYSSDEGQLSILLSADKWFGLVSGFSPTHDPITRGEVAVLLYLALDGKKISYDANGIASVAASAKPYAEEVFNLQKITGKLVANEFFGTGAAAGKAKLEYVDSSATPTTQTKVVTLPAGLTATEKMEYLGRSFTVQVNTKTGAQYGEIRESGTSLKTGYLTAADFGDNGIFKTFNEYAVNYTEVTGSPAADIGNTQEGMYYHAVLGSDGKPVYVYFINPTVAVAKVNSNNNKFTTVAIESPLVAIKTGATYISTEQEPSNVIAQGVDQIKDNAYVLYYQIATGKYVFMDNFDVKTNQTVTGYANGTKAISFGGQSVLFDKNVEGALDMSATMTSSLIAAGRDFVVYNGKLLAVKATPGETTTPPEVPVYYGILVDAGLQNKVSGVGDGYGNETSGKDAFAKATIWTVDGEKVVKDFALTSEIVDQTSADNAKILDASELGTLANDISSADGYTRYTAANNGGLLISWTNSDKGIVISIQRTNTVSYTESANNLEYNGVKHYADGDSVFFYYKDGNGNIGVSSTIPAWATTAAGTTGAVVAKDGAGGVKYVKFAFVPTATLATAPPPPVTGLTGIVLASEMSTYDKNSDTFKSFTGTEAGFGNVVFKVTVLKLDGTVTTVYVIGGDDDTAKTEDTFKRGEIFDAATLKGDAVTLVDAIESTKADAAYTGASDLTTDTFIAATVAAVGSYITVADLLAANGELIAVSNVDKVIKVTDNTAAVINAADLATSKAADALTKYTTLLYKSSAAGSKYVVIQFADGAIFEVVTP